MFSGELGADMRPARPSPMKSSGSEMPDICKSVMIDMCCHTEFRAGCTATARMEGRGSAAPRLAYLRDNKNPTRPIGAKWDID
jgi:hypothetical protein